MTKPFSLRSKRSHSAGCGRLLMPIYLKELLEFHRIKTKKEKEKKITDSFPSTSETPLIDHCFKTQDRFISQGVTYPRLFISSWRGIERKAQTMTRRTRGEKQRIHPNRMFSRVESTGGGLNSVIKKSEQFLMSSKKVTVGVRRFDCFFGCS